MSDKLICKACNQSLEAPPEMSGQLIDCPTCKKPIEIPFSRPPVAAEHVQHDVGSRPENNDRLRENSTQEPPSSSPMATPPQTKASSPYLVFAVVILTLVCLGLAGGMYYLLSEKKVAGQISGTPVAPTKENASLARRNIDRQTLAEKVLPDSTIDGEVFVVTRGGQSIKLGLVEAVLIPMDTLTPHLDARTAEKTNAFARLDPQIQAAEAQIQAAEAEVQRLQQEEHALFELYLKDVFLNSEKERTYRAAQDATSQARRKESQARRKASALREEKRSFMSGAFYFDSLPSPLRGTKTNSDGRFRLMVPASGSYAIAAVASRHVVDRVERYYWLLKIDSKAGSSQAIMLSNDNMTSSDSVESLIRTF